MKEFNRENHEHLGDGVYIEWVPEGHPHIILRANDHRDALCTSKIFIDEMVLGNLFQWLRHKKILQLPDSYMLVMEQDEHLRNLEKLDAKNSLQEEKDVT